MVLARWHDAGAAAADHRLNETLIRLCTLGSGTRNIGGQRVWLIARLMASRNERNGISRRARFDQTPTAGLRVRDSIAINSPAHFDDFRTARRPQRELQIPRHLPS